MARPHLLTLAGLLVCGLAVPPALGQTDLQNPMQPPPPGGPPAYAPPPYAPPPMGAAPGAPPGGPADETGQRSARIVDRFHAANTTNDGRLTLQQAQAAGLAPVVRHFAELDPYNRGYITLQDIRGFIQRMRATRAQTPGATQ